MRETNKHRLHHNKVVGCVIRVLEGEKRDYGNGEILVKTVV